MNEIKKFSKMMKPYTKYYIIMFICVIFNTALSLPLPLIVKYIIDKLIPNKDMIRLNYVILLLGGAYVARAILNYHLQNLYGSVGHNISTDLRKQIFDNIQALPLEYINKQSAGSLVSRVMDDVAQINQIFTSTFIDIIAKSVTFLATLSILIIIDWKLTLFNAVFVPILWLTKRKFDKKLRNQAIESREQSGIVVGKLFERIVNQKIIRAFNCEKIFENSLLQEMRNLVKIHLKGIRISLTVSQITFLTVVAGPLFILWYGSRIVIGGFMTLGSMIAFYQYLIQAYQPIQEISRYNMEIQEALGAMRRISEFMDLSKDRAREGSIHCTLSGEIAFDNVSFSYDGNGSVLKNISFKIKPGEMVGFVGPSGAGKTTISNIILKFYHIKSGNVYLDNYNLNDIDTKSLRDQIGIVTQEPYLFRESVEDNIRMGNNTASFEEVREAAKMAHIDDYIISLPEKYGTVVDERGLNLSGGQMQRITLARAFLKKPKILIFDEATSSLDSNLEQMIRLTLEESMKDITCLVIAHRLSTVINADKIIVINNGEIEEEGNHMGLLKNKGLYYKLFNQQYKVSKNESERSEEIEGRLGEFIS